MDDIKGGGGGIGSHGADGKGGGMEKGNPGIAPGAAEAPSAFGWVELLAPDSAPCACVAAALVCGASVAVCAPGAGGGGGAPGKGPQKGNKPGGN